jgi:HK97 family phage portal protein
LYSGRYIRFDLHPDVKICIKKIVDLISSMTIYFMHNGEFGDVRVVNRFSRVLDISPNSYLTRQKLMSKVVDELLITGNSVLIPKYEKNTDSSFSVDYFLTGLIPVAQNNVIYTPLEDDVSGYYLTINGVKFSHDDVLHFTYNNDTLYPWRGLGLRVYLRDVLRTLDYAEKIKSDYYTKHYKPNVIFSFNADTVEFTSEEQRENIYSKWLQTKPGTPYILPAQLIDVKTMAPMSLQDIAINESVELDKKLIASMFGLPLFMVGLAPYNEDEYNYFVNTTIAPLVKGIAQEFTKKLIISDDYYVKFNLESLKAFKTEQKINMMYEGKKIGAFSANEIRVQAGFEPVDDKSMNEYSMLENYIPINKLGNQKKLLGGEES